MNCQFCYTGRMGLLGNLTTAQIIDQVVEVGQEGHTNRVCNVAGRLPGLPE